MFGTGVGVGSRFARVCGRGMTPMPCYIGIGHWFMCGVVEAFARGQLLSRKPSGLIACNTNCKTNQVGLILSVSLQTFKAEVFACLFVVISQLHVPKMLVEHTLHMRIVLVAGSVS